MEVSEIYGCIIKNVHLTIQQPIELIIMEHTTKNETDVKFITIQNSHITQLPNTDKFMQLEECSISYCSGLAELDNIQFNSFLKDIAIIHSDIEIIDETVFKKLNLVDVLELSNNKIKTIHKNAFKDLVDLQIILLDSNLLETLDDNTFAYNSELSEVKLNDNKLKILPTILFSTNMKLKYLSLKDNFINQIEEGFYLNMKEMEKLNLNNNKCFDDEILLDFAMIKKFEEDKSFKSCYSNFEMMKETKDEIKNLENQLHNMSEIIQNLAAKATNDLNIPEDITDLENNSTNSLSFWNKSIEELENKFKIDLENVSSDIRTNLKNTIEQYLESKIMKHDNLDVELYNLTEVNTAKLNMVDKNVDSVTDYSHATFKHIYFLYLMVIILSVAVSFSCYIIL